MTTRSTRALALAAVLAMALVLGACGASGSDSSKKSSGSTTTTAQATTTSSVGGSESTTSTTAAQGTTTEAGGGTTSMPEDPEGTDTETSTLDTLPDGVHYGYMAGLESGKVEGQDVQVIIFDKAEFFTGQAAVDAAHEDGAIPADQDYVDDDYYIRNQNQRVRRLAVVPEATVTSLQDGSPTPVPSSVDQVWKQPYLFKIDVGNVRGITTVSSIEAVYLP